MDLIPELMQIGAQGPELGWQGEEMVSRLKKKSSSHWQVTLYS